jgi:SAM-dependent methyltransferase
MADKMKAVDVIRSRDEDHRVGQYVSHDTLHAWPERLNWLLISEIKEGLDGIESWNFPMYLMTKRITSPHENGFNDRLRFVAENPAYQYIRESERTLLNSIDRKSELDRDFGVAKIVDIGCGNGETLQEFVSAVRWWSDTAKTRPIDLIDTSGIAVQQARDALAWYATKTIIGDVFSSQFQLLHGAEGNSRGVVFTSFGGGRSNYSSDQKQQLRNRMGVGWMKITSAFAYPKSEEKKQLLIDGYSGPAAKDQIWNTLKAVWFSDENLAACDFEVKRVDEVPGTKWHIASGFVPRQDITVTSVVQKKYDSDRFYPLYDSRREDVCYELDERQEGKLGAFDQTVNQRSNDTHIITLQRLYQWEKQEKKEKREATLKEILGWTWWVVVLALFMMWIWIFKDHDRVSKKQKSEMEALYYTWSDFSIPLINIQEQSTKLMEKTMTWFEGICDRADMENPYIGETGVIFFNDNDRESWIAPINWFVRKHRHDTLTTGQAIGTFFEENASLFVGKRYWEPIGRLSPKYIDDCNYTLGTDLRYNVWDMNDIEIAKYVDSVGKKLDEHFAAYPDIKFKDLWLEISSSSKVTYNISASKCSSPRGEFIKINLGDLRSSEWSYDLQEYTKPRDSVSNFLLFIPPECPKGATTRKDLLPYSLQQARDMLYAQRQYEMCTKWFPSGF